MISGSVYISNSMFAGFYSQGWVVEDAAMARRTASSRAMTRPRRHSGRRRQRHLREPRRIKRTTPSLKVSSGTNFTNVDLDGVHVMLTLARRAT